MKFGWKGWLGIAISAALIWWQLSTVENPREVVRLVGEANFLMLGAAIFVATFGFFIRALRWRILLQPIKEDTALNSRFGAVTIGFMANNLLPARVGEFARAYALGRFEKGVPVSAAFGSLVVERVLDGLVLAAFLVGAVLMPGFPELPVGGAFGAILKSAVTLIGGVMLFLVALLSFPKRVAALASWAASFLPESGERLVVDSFDAFQEALGVVRSPRLLLAAFVWTVGFWLWHGLSFWLGMLAFGIDAGMVAAFFTEAVVGFGVALPAAPGFFGTFHMSAQFALQTVYGVGEEATLAFAYAYHLGGFFPVTFIGLWYARSLGLSLAQVGDSETQVEEAIEDGTPSHGTTS